MKLLLGALIGGIVVFIWGSVSWMMLSWHENTLLPFTNEPAVASVVKAGAPVSGVYLLPHARAAQPSEPRQSRAKQGPVLLAAVNLEGADPANPAYYLRGLLIEIIGAGFMTALLLSLPGLSFWGCVRTSLWVGVTAGMLCRLPDWGWWGFSQEFTLISIVDLGISWFLGGLAIAAVLGRR